jgi:hypothetical protein
MVFETIDGWKLYEKDMFLKGGKHQMIYIFSKGVPTRSNPCDLPDGYSVGVNKRTGLPYVKRK